MRKAACHFFLICFNHAATHSNVEISLDAFCCAMLDCILSPLDCDPCPHSVWNMALSQKFPFSFKNLWVFPLQPDVLTTVLVLAAGPSLPPLHTKLLFWSLTGSLQSSHNKHRESKAPLPPPPRHPLCFLASPDTMTTGGLSTKEAGCVPDGITGVTVRTFRVM